MASYIGSIISAMTSPVVKSLFKCLCCFTGNITDLEREAEELDIVERGLQEQVDRQRENQQVILPIVESLLTKSKDINNQKNTILGEVPNVRSGCLKLIDRLWLSKRAMETSDLIKELRGQYNVFVSISGQGPPAATRGVPLGTTLEFESRKRFEDGIMTTLRHGKKSMIGICGMGGLGKTTMAKKIINRVLEEHMFEEAVMVVVSQQVDKTMVQVEIGESLGLDLKDKSWQARVQKLHARLSGTKRILLVLDDVWEPLELEELGVPYDSRGCTVLITSRNNDALDYMNVQMVFGMKVLDEEEAWSLFRGRAGTCVDDTGLHSIARVVVQECTGLPIALITLGAALKDEKRVAIWENALQELRQSVQNIPHYIGKVYNPLKLSYDRLTSDEAKSLFLLCCLFLEDYDIPLEQLTYFCTGLGIFKGIRNLEDARNRTLALTKMLKSRSLLLDGDDEDYVRMHDVVRDVCIFIAKQKGYIGSNECTWISSPQLVGQTNEFSAGLGFPNLHLLFLMSPYYSEEEFELNSAFLEGIRDIRVLCIENYNSLTSIPHTRDSLTNLKTLVLDSCKELKTISVVGKLVNLEILICLKCSSIEELPLDLKSLKRLKVLELSKCSKLQTIGVGIISSLVGLDELKITGCFKKWEAEDSELKHHARLRELEALTNLTCLEIEIEDPGLVAEQMHISSKLQIFTIIFSDEPDEFSTHPFRKKLSLGGLKGGILRLGDWIEMQLLRDTECLYLSGDGANNVDLAKCQNIRWLELSECKTMKNIVKSSMVENATIFPFINYLGLNNLSQLEEICDAPISSTSFQNVSSIEINNCPSLRNLWQFSIAGKDCLPQLELLDIRGCVMMEQVFMWNENKKPQTITRVFPKLKVVKLYRLPNLATFYQGIEGVEFPILTIFEIVGCTKIKSIVSSDCLIGTGSNLNNSVDSNNADIQHSSHSSCQLEKVSTANLKQLTVDWNPFCSHKIDVSSFNGLESLSITRYHGSMSLSTSIAKNLASLKRLSISDCDEMVQVIEDEKIACGGERSTVILFPKLVELNLYFLPKMVSFFGCKCNVELPSLSHVDIKRCPKMKNFSLGSLSAPELEYLETDLNHDLEVGVEVSFDKLKKLRIIRNNKHPCYHHKLFMSLVNGLEGLRIDYDTVISFPATIVSTTFNCRVLYLSYCYEMVKVIEDEEKVIEDDGQRTLPFPNLEELRLDHLPKLSSFCEWTCDIKLPSLRRVEIIECPKLKYFSFGPLSTPNLETVSINFKYIDVKKDLNDALQQQYLARVKEEDEDDEEEGRTGEIQEEQNI